MIDSHIDDGDYVVIRKQDTADNGDRVVAMIDNEVTLKRFYKEKDHIRLEPANGRMNPIIVDSTKDAKILVGGICESHRNDISASYICVCGGLPES